MNPSLMILGLAWFLAAPPADDAARLVDAKAALQTEDYDKAIQLLERILAQDSPDEDLRTQARRYAALAYHRRGENRFRVAQIALAVQDFDREVALQPESEPHHWQRGIAYYYAGLYEKGVKQFESHQTVNSQDVENAVWHFLCAVRAPGGTIADARQQLIPITQDPRNPMKEVHRLFAGKIAPEDVLSAVKPGSDTGQFYADLYIGLYYEAIGDSKKSQAFIESAAKNPAARDSYMGDVARVHAKLRAQKNKPTGDDPQ